MKESIKKHIEASLDIKQKISNDENLIDSVEQAIKAIIQSYKNKGTVLVAGNGGSASDAQHICGELVNRFYVDRPPLSCIALSTDTTVITAIGNDYNFNQIFSKQVEANGNKGDIFIAISTSGNSKNIIEALKVCRKKEIITIGLTGANQGEMEEFCDYLIKVPSTETPRIQEGHIVIYHTMCAIIEEHFFGK